MGNTKNDKEMLKTLNNISSSLNDIADKEKDNKMDTNWINIASLVLSIIAIVFTGISVYLQYNFSQKEYKYKLPPIFSYSIGGERKIYSNYEIEYDLNDYQIKILEENNLDSMYIIDKDNKIINVNKDEFKNEINGLFKKDNPLIIEKESGEKIKYYYNFIVLKSFSNQYSVYLIYSKNGKTSNWALLTSTQLYGFEKLENSKENQGEKIILKHYKNIIKWLEEFTI